ncbi:hypothetical protein CFB40_30765 [Burkholderia sp. AU31652]|nr:hypothetical protein CFB40_30765 [Burkholderia sp. AU31652]
MREPRTGAPTASAPDARFGPAACRAVIAGQTGEYPSGFLSRGQMPDRRAGKFPASLYFPVFRLHRLS